MQEFIFSVGSLVLAVNLFPMVMANQPPPYSSSITTTLVLWLYAGAFISMGLWFSSICVAITALMWTIMVVQKTKRRYRYNI